MNSLKSTTAEFDVTQAFTERLGDGARATDLKKVSKDFESVFVSMMLKSMRQSMSSDMFPGDGSDTFGGLFDSFMGQHIADSGGIGLDRFFESLTQVSNASSRGEKTPTANHQASVEAYRHADVI